MQKNRILAKNRRYAKMRENENSHTLAKIEWPAVQRWIQDEILFDPQKNYKNVRIYRFGAF